MKQKARRDILKRWPKAHTDILRQKEKCEMKEYLSENKKYKNECFAMETGQSQLSSLKCKWGTVVLNGWPWWREVRETGEHLLLQCVGLEKERDLINSKGKKVKVLEVVGLILCNYTTLAVSQNFYSFSLGTFASKLHTRSTKNFTWFNLISKVIDRSITW